MSDRNPPSGSTSALLGDLESIRALLAEQQAAAQQAVEQGASGSGTGTGTDEDDPAGDAHGAPQSGLADDEEVPLLEDVVQGGVSVSEAFLSGEGDFGDSDSASALRDDVFQALLSDEWRESADHLIGQARGALETAPALWSADDTEALNAALKIRVDETLQRWLRAAVLNGIDDLRRELLEAVRQQLAESISARFNETSPDEDPDGA